MIRIFRKIRQSFLGEIKKGKSSRHMVHYALYALGEVLLVGIGIILALQVNEWNDQRKKVVLENDYYCRLLEDVKLDHEQIQKLVSLAEARLVASNQSVRLLLSDNSDKIEIGRQIALAIRAIYSDFQPNNSAYQDLKSGANLNIITDKSVIRNLNRYFSRVEELKSIIMVNGKQGVDIFYAHNDYFSNGFLEASIAEGHFKIGLDDDMKTKLRLISNQPLGSKMRTRLLNESLEFVRVNTRQIELYENMLEEIAKINFQLKRKCSI